MDRTFSEILQEHFRRYPNMQPQDVGKLLYQHVFGPEHMVADPAQVLPYLVREWRATAKDPAARPEDIGNGLCRFPLAALPDEDACARLAELFCRTAQQHTGRQDALLALLPAAEALPLAGLPDWLARWREQGCPPVHHSEAYRSAYAPHYRLVSGAEAEQMG